MNIKIIKFYLCQQYNKDKEKIAYRKDTQGNRSIAKNRYESICNNFTVLLNIDICF
jgi:hypothetical protein